MLALRIKVYKTGTYHLFCMVVKYCQLHSEKKKQSAHRKNKYMQNFCAETCWKAVDVAWMEMTEDHVSSL
jgi:hypothetical protein